MSQLDEAIARYHRIVESDPDRTRSRMRGQRALERMAVSVDESGKSERARHEPRRYQGRRPGSDRSDRITRRVSR
jgi:hypothetical protein